MTMSRRTINLFITVIVVISFFTANAKITVSGPQKFQEQFTEPITAKYSIFGSVKYGFTTYGKLYYDPSNIESDYACKPIKTISIDETDASYVPVIMVDRGNCSFVTKVRNVQNIGGQVALIVNNKDENDFDTIFALNDDGTGNDIRIPGILISKQDGEKLKRFFSENQDNKGALDQIVLNIDNTFQSLSEKVDLKIDFSSGDKKVYQLLQKLMRNKDIVQQEGGKINITPNYITRSAFAYKKDEAKVHANCMCNGRYCSTSTAPDGFLKTTSEDVLVENIRQKCIYKITHDTSVKTSTLKNHSLIFWNYMSEFYNICMSSQDFSLSCSRKVLQNLDDNNGTKLNTLVEDCFISSFKYDEKTKANGTDQYTTCLTNDILEQDSNAVEARIKNILPIIYVNSYTFYGTWSYENVFEAMCASLKDKPSSCYNTFSELFGNDDKIFGFNFSHLLLILSIFVLFNIIVIFSWRRYVLRNKVDERVSAKDINDKIHDIVSHYIALREKK